MLDDLRRAARKTIELLSRPVRAARGRGGFVVQPYRGYGSREEVFLIGRVFRQPEPAASRRRSVLGGELSDLGRRLLRRGVADAPLIARFCGTEQAVTADRDGYFRIHLRPATPPPADRLWHRMAIELLAPARAEAAGEVFVPPDRCRSVVISDIDDTIMYTGVANKALMLWRLFTQGARSRVAFPGVAAFLRALHHGRSGAELNPMLYVSRAPWSIYEVLDEFFNLHDIPVGPILFLREWGLTLQSPLPRRASGHKLALIRNMLALYHELPFVLIGDSGQRDPEIYAQIVREHPGRVRATYIRNVSRAPERRHAIEALALEVAEAGSTLLLAADTVAMAEHAAEHGLIAPAACAAVLREHVTQDGAPNLKPPVAIERTGPVTAREAVRQGDLADALERPSGDEVPPNVVVEAEEDRR